MNPTEPEDLDVIELPAFRKRKAVRDAAERFEHFANLDAAIQHFTPVHGAVFARIPPETDLHPRSEEED